MQKQYTAIDWAKTIGVFLICLAHFFPVGSVERIFVYSFHVPMFFLISGFLWKPEKVFCTSSVLKIAKRVLIPYCSWFCLSIFPQIMMGETSLGFYLEKFFFISGRTLWNSALWFIPCYFSVSIVHMGLCRLAKNRNLSRKMDTLKS